MTVLDKTVIVSTNIFNDGFYNEPSLKILILHLMTVFE